VDKAQE
jgi:hypothetical protein